MFLYPKIPKGTIVMVGPAWKQTNMFGVVVDDYQHQEYSISVVWTSGDRLDHTFNYAYRQITPINVHSSLSKRRKATHPEDKPKAWVSRTRRPSKLYRHVCVNCGYTESYKKSAPIYCSSIYCLVDEKSPTVLIDPKDYEAALALREKIRTDGLIDRVLKGPEVPAIKARRPGENKHPSLYQNEIYSLASVASRALMEKKPGWMENDVRAWGNVVLGVADTLGGKLDNLPSTPSFLREEHIREYMLPFDQPVRSVLCSANWRYKDLVRRALGA